MDDIASIVADHLGSLGAVVARRMFGGAGLFLDGLMFALIADGVLYLKVDDANRPDFQAEGLAPFTYARKGQQATLTSYWQAPERLIDEPEEMLAWGGKAAAVARRANARKAPRKPTKAKPTKSNPARTNRPASSTARPARARSRP